jgi:hypothetical protein
VLPSEYRGILDDGFAALQWVEAELRHHVQRSPEATDVWLAIRDAASLAGRLDEDDWVWQTGFAGIMSSPQDLVVLDAFAAQCEELSPYRSDEDALMRAGHLRRLRAFLMRYQARDFDFEDPDTFPNPANAPSGG